MKKVNFNAVEIAAALNDERKDYLNVRPLYNDREWQYFAEILIDDRYKVICEKVYSFYAFAIYDTSVVEDTFERWGKTCPVYKVVGRGVFSITTEDGSARDRWCKSVVEHGVNQIMDAISEYEGKIDDKTHFLMCDVVENYQPECDSLAAAANEYHRRGNLEMTKEYLERIKALCDHVLEVCSVISECNMVPDDGFYPDLSELYITADGISLDDEIELLASKLAA